MEKILKKYTTIPDHLYVNRSADTQLASIVDEMERPGYVLVARQMGKTNLLFHAKSTLENEGRLFVYVDLSNYYENERDCYRNIVDCIIEPNEEIFEDIVDKIEKIRDKDLPSHKEYSKSIISLLRFFDGDIVIILDEIDALRSAIYSDHIFAQIRSNYFTRTNFPEFKRLTYILSGVIEPTDLIKDKNKSPFNIGEKIYLDDFSKLEHDGFISKSKLKICSETSAEIYSWTSGSPRLTFDLCSEIESEIISGKSISVSSIEEIVTKKYLTSFDVAPVDHIRELVKTNKDARKAVFDIQKNRDDLSDEMKTKLYLYGIIGSDFHEKTKVKNKIISKSLSVEWIDSFDKGARNELTYGLQKVDDGEYEDAIKILLNYLETSIPNANEIEACNNSLGLSYYQIGDYEKALVFCSKEYSTEPYISSAETYYAMCLLNEGDEKALEIFEGLRVRKADEFSYSTSVLNLAINLPIDEFDRSISLYQELFDFTFESKSTDEKELNKHRVLSQYGISKTCYMHKEMDRSIVAIKLAKEYARSNDLPFLTFNEYFLSGSENIELLKEIVETTVSKGVLFGSGSSNELSFSVEYLNLYVISLFSHGLYDLADTFLLYSGENLFDKKVSKCQVAYNVLSISDKRDEILSYILENKDMADDELLLRVYCDSCFYTDSISKTIDIFPEYLRRFKKELVDVVVDDIYAFIKYIKYHSDNNEIQRALELCRTIVKRIESTNNESIRFEVVTIYYWFATLFFSIKDKDSAVYYCNKTLHIVSEIEKSSEKTSMVDEEGLKAISEQMNQIIVSCKTSTPIKRGKKFGRNEKVSVKYLDQSVESRKFKYLEADIIAGRCQIIE